MYTYTFIAQVMGNGRNYMKYQEIFHKGYANPVKSLIFYYEAGVFNVYFQSNYLPSIAWSLFTRKHSLLLFLLLLI